MKDFVSMLAHLSIFLSDSSLSTSSVTDLCTSIVQVNVDSSSGLIYKIIYKKTLKLKSYVIVLVLFPFSQSLSLDCQSRSCS